MFNNPDSERPSTNEIVKNTMHNLNFSLESMLTLILKVYPLLQDFLWGNYDPKTKKLSMPQAYFGGDFRGFLLLAVDYYQLNQDNIDVSNFQEWHALLNHFDPEETFFIHGHFSSSASPYYALMVRLDCPYLKEIYERLEGLESYPVLNEDRLSEIEFNSVCNIWFNADISERVSWLQDANLNVFAARNEELPSDINSEIINPDNHFCP